MSSILLSLPQRYKRQLQAMTLAVIIIYTTLVFYQSSYGYPNIEISQNPSQKYHHKVGEVQTHHMKLLQYETSTTNTPTSTTTQQQSSSAAAAASSSLSQSSSTQDLIANPVHTTVNQPTTVIIRKDIHSFNFSDIELPIERPTASAHYLRNKHLLRDLSQRSVTGTPKPPTTELDDIFISVKTTKSYHDSRLALIVKTWFQLAKDQTWFFTDTDDPYYQQKTNGHLINTKCSQGHFRKALCCKMSAELDVFLESGKKWFCHFDDDNYVNIPRLVKLLDEYSPSVDWYLGKPSISSPLEIHLDSKNTSLNKRITFWFATGGAGFCLSRALTLKMLPIAGGGKFISIGDKIRFPDDVTMGFIIEHLLKVPLTVVDNFHSHLEPMEFIRPDSYQNQVSFSYALMKNQWNVVKVDGFDTKTDPRRFYSLHCKLFPYFSYCPHR
ncbi:fringe glycosyltransferase isoform X1 [Lucilia sericata]|uniref:fringe glycosyltransferase isoform X1 n=2 Tax=Lucilia sericata TaxID=13632 RepID=UPI0018A8730D|nr:fringe glycosyltransferase isoform X1 [Lucilia sericata]